VQHPWNLSGNRWGGCINCFSAFAGIIEEMECFENCGGTRKAQQVRLFHCKSKRALHISKKTSGKTRKESASSARGSHKAVVTVDAPHSSGELDFVL